MRAFYEQYEFNVGKNPLYEGADALPAAPPPASAVRFIAYYLPQFHPIAENDAWWGAGFTEWTNVSKALPRFRGHQQPRMPADLGFYDLRSADTLRKQAALAKRAGIHGFCIHNYWFSGRRVLETPLRLLLENRDIDLRFCLNWANESWSRRWDGLEHDILLEQRHDPDDDLRYVESLLPALRDPRYIRIDGRPLIMLYRPSLLPNANASTARWRSFLRDHGVGDPYLVMPQVFEETDPRPYGMDAAAGFPPHGGWHVPDERSSVQLFDPQFEGHVCSYDVLAERMLDKPSSEYRVFPGVCPGWDNEARKPGQGFGFYGSTPASYGAWLASAARKVVADASGDERLVFINAWNEWAEGAHLEPDRHFGYAYLAETRRVVDGLNSASVTPGPTLVSSDALRLMRPHPSAIRQVFNRLRRFWSRRRRAPSVK